MGSNPSQPMGLLGPNLDPNAPIYLVYPQRFLENLLRGKLVIRSTRTWTDPYEKLVSQCGYAAIENGKIRQHFIEKNVLPTFGQCWSTCRESDAMWRIYSKVHQDGSALDSAFDADEAVRLRTSPQKLLNALVGGLGIEKGGNCFIARMRYFSENALLQEIANTIGSNRENAFSGAAGQADALLFKRDAFTHEQEVRLLYVDTKCEFLNQDQIEISVDPNSLIDEITVDPRVRGGQQEAWRIAWIRGLGFSNEINRSLLYQNTLMIVPLFSQEELAKLSNSQSSPKPA